jgi:hypothetical protein
MTKIIALAALAFALVASIAATTLQSAPPTYPDGGCIGSTC